MEGNEFATQPRPALWLLIFSATSYYMAHFFLISILNIRAPSPYLPASFLYQRKIPELFIDTSTCGASKCVVQPKPYPSMDLTTIKHLSQAFPGPSGLSSISRLPQVRSAARRWGFLPYVP